MKKTGIALLLALGMTVMSLPCFAADVPDTNTADALNALGLFLGTGNGYELDRGLSRAEGVTLLVRMIGKEEAAKSGTYENSFTDVPDWAAGYVGYAFENKITNGTGETTFSSDAAMTDDMFLTLVLRALDYSDRGEAPLFTWDAPYALAYELALIETAEPDAAFTRADAIRIFWNALDVELHNSETTLSERLLAQKVFTAAELAEAEAIRKNGRKENAAAPVRPSSGSGGNKVDTPTTNAPELGSGSDTGDSLGEGGLPIAP